MQAQVAHALHKTHEARNVEAVLGLNELRAGRSLFGQPVRSPIVGRREGIFGRAEKHARRRGELAPAQKHATVAHGAGDLQKLDRVEVEDALGLGLIAIGHVVAGQAKHIAHAQRRRA